MSCHIAAFYQFVEIDSPEELRETLRLFCHQLQLKGVMLVSAEGINATMAGPHTQMEKLLSWLRNDVRFADMTVKEARAPQNPFVRLRVRLKKEIVSLGIDGVDPNQMVGTYVSPSDWNLLIQDPDVTLIDVRNDYEIQVGTFEGAINPHTDQFRDFPAWVDAHLDPQQNTKVAMFCTGGIRCEKATSLLKSKGFEVVYHLEGGILQYLNDVSEEDSLWEGECFVFDKRIAVNHQLAPGSTELCHACSYPTTEKDRRSEHYVRGVSCPRCHDRWTEEQKQRFAERQHQMDLAAQRTEVHLGMQQKLPESHPLKHVRDSRNRLG